MEKIFKKSLALVLSAALCLTALVGCLTVSAADETTNPIYEMVGAEGKAGETVTVTAKLQNIEGICAHHVKFTFAKELTVVSMYDVTRGRQVKFDTDVLEGENFQFKKSIDTNTGVTTVEDVNILNFVKSDNTYDEHTPSLTLTFNVKIADGTADGNYAVNVTATAAEQSEAWVNTIDFRNSNVVVKNTVEPIEPETINLTFRHTLSLKSNIRIAIVPTLTDEFKNAKSVYAITQQTKLDNSNVPYTYTSEPFYAEANGYFYYGDMLAYEMPYEVSTVIYACDEDGNVIYKSNVDTYSVVQYVANQFMNPKSTDELKTVLANLLNYGAAAQNYANYNTDNLVNTIGDFESTYGTANISNLVEQYQTVGDPNMNSVANSTGDQSIELRNSLSLKSAVEVVWAIPKSAVDGKENIKLVVNYNGKDYTYTVSGFKSFNSSYYGLYFDKVIAADFNKTLTAVLYEGDVAISKTRIYSIESYCKNKENDSDVSLANVCKAIMKYGNSVDAYFS